MKETFAAIPQRIIWKLDEDISGLSNNVFMSKWVPQKEILGERVFICSFFKLYVLNSSQTFFYYDKLVAHPNTVAFMSHCGLMSTYEAIHYAKPMLTIPIFADQPSTAVRLQELGVGLHLDLMDTSKEELIMLLEEVVNKTK